jgi:catechol 2,3-dioxygenase-like lactoylglutathione lyase family enzyme
MNADEPKLIPELDVSDLVRSLRFYVDVLGFRVVYERHEEAFAMLEREGARLMIEAAPGPGRRFTTAPLERPYGRGMNLQILVSDAHVLYASVGDAGFTPLIPMEEKWYDVGGDRKGNRQFVVADPDGYLLRFFEDLG